MVSRVMFDASSSVVSKRRAVDMQDFSAVIMVGYGENLYPFNQGTNVISKALVPVGNVPIINTVLDWVLASGVRDILVIVPNTFHTQIADYISEHYSLSTHPRTRLDIKRLSDGEKDEDDEQSEGPIGGDALGQRDGTARVLRRFRHFIKADFVLLPCDLAPPQSLSLASILDRHRSNPSAVLTSVFYEPIESVKDGEEKLLVATDKATNELLLVQPLEGLEDDLELRTSLLTSHPTLSLSTRLLDAHIYVLRRTVLDLLNTRRSKDLDSMRDQVIPWLIKGGWQKGLGERWASILNPPRYDPFADALARSTTAGPSSSALDDLSMEASPEHTPYSLATAPASPAGSDESRMPSPSGGYVNGIKQSRTGRQRRKHDKWVCQVIVAAPEPVAPAAPTRGGKPDKGKVVAEPDYLIRANSLAGYWELNRRFLRQLASTITGKPPISNQTRGPTSMSNDDSTAGTAPAISPSAQISPDSLVGEGTRVGEKASIKKCVIGRHCVIGRGAKITGCVLWDFVTIEENARIENSILCSNGRIGEKAQIKDCEFGTGFEAMPGAILKGERLIAGQEA